MTSTERLASILKQFIITPQGPALDEELKHLLDIHATEAKELQKLRDDYATIEGELDQAHSAYTALRSEFLKLAARVDALEARNASDDKVAEEALAGFTGQPNATEPTGADASGVSAPEAAGAAETPPPAPVAESETGA